MVKRKLLAKLMTLIESYLIWDQKSQTNAHVGETHKKLLALICYLIFSPPLKFYSIKQLLCSLSTSLTIENNLIAPKQMDDTKVKAQSIFFTAFLCHHVALEFHKPN